MLIPKSKPLMVPVPKTTNFRIPEGSYRSKISSVRKQYVEKLASTGETVKLLFEVQVPSLQKTVNLAKAEFRLDLNPGSELHNVLTRLFGKQALADKAGGEFDLGELEGMTVDIEIEHVITNRRDEYDYPLVKVRDIQIAGTLVKAEGKPEQEPTKEGGSTAQK
jgi:hypothetical protein